MSLSSNTSRVTAVATAGQTIFPFSNIFVTSGDDLDVYQNGVQLAPSTYGVSLTTPTVLPSDGSIVLDTGATVSDIIIIERRTVASQTTVYNAGTAFPAKSHELALDKLTMHVQDLLRIFTQTPAFSSNLDANLGYVYDPLPDATTPKFPQFNPASNTITWQDAAPTGVGADFSTLTGTLNISGSDARVLDITPGLTGAVARGLDERVLEWYTVKDFGAVGDGAADDSAAFTACEAAAGNGFVYVPVGTYKLSSSVSVTNIIIGAGATLSPDVATVLTISGFMFAPSSTIFGGAGTQEITFQRPVFPEWWGGAGDGATDNQAALSKADAACQDFDHHIHLANGQYNLGSTWTSTSRGFKLTGAGSDPSGTRIAMTVGTTNVIDIDSLGNVFIGDVAFQATVTRTSDANVSIKSTAVKCDGVKMSNVRHSGAFVGVHLVDCVRVAIENSEFFGGVALGAGILVDLETAGTDGGLNITGCDFDNSAATGRGIVLESGRGVSIVGCTFGVLEHGIRIAPKTADFMNNVSISGNTFVAGTWGVRFVVAAGHVSSGVSRGFSITGNSFGIGTAVHVDVAAQNSGDTLFRGIAITGNTFETQASSTSVNILAQGEVAISGNSFHGQAGTTRGIDVAAAAVEVLASGNLYSNYAADTFEFSTAVASAIQAPRWLYDARTVDPGSVAAAAGSIAGPYTVTGAQLGDMAFAQHSLQGTTNMSLSARVSAADTVWVTYKNNNAAAGAAIDLASGTQTIVILQPGVFV